jgi:glutathione S-transferase
VWAACRAERDRLGLVGPFLFGHFTVADAFFAPVVVRFRAYGPVSGARLCPTDAAYCATIEAMPELQEWLAAGAAESHRIAAYETEA